MEKKKYPVGADNYTLYEEVGSGVSAAVHRALCITLNEIVAIKIMDFERDNCDLNNVSREAQTMCLVDHPNVLKSHCSFVSDHNLWVVMPYMAGGSCLHILKAAHPDGFKEVIIATLLKEVLKGLEYLHNLGQIHRDVKAGNILIGAHGEVKLGDFGVSACLFDSGDRQRPRKSLAGTPCWMAPEVMEQVNGYDFRADIWSFAITALEFAHGHAPFSKLPPIKVFLMTLQNAPPGLDYERDKKFSKEKTLGMLLDIGYNFRHQISDFPFNKHHTNYITSSFKQMIAICLVKDPSKRPSAKTLLKHPFFKKAKSSDFIVKMLLDGLPALGDRLQELKRKDEVLLAQKRIPDGKKEEISQNEYIRGISGWNFDLDDMKAQASLIQDEDIVSDKDQKGSIGSPQEGIFQYQFSFRSQCSDSTELGDNNQPALPISADSTCANTVAKGEKSDDDVSIASSMQDSHNSSNCSIQNLSDMEIHLSGKVEPEVNGKSPEKSKMHWNQSDKFHIQIPSPSSYISDIAPKTVVNNDELDEKAKGPVVQQRGRFKVTSENVDFEKVGSPLQKSQSMQVISQHPAVVSLPVTPTDTAPPNLPKHFLYPMIQSLLQSNILQREYILGVMKQLAFGESATVNQAVDGGVWSSTNTIASEKSLLESAHDREKDLLREITDLQRRLISVQEELQKHKTGHPPADS